jgi:MoaA/NifB/PqqE/SkfB family radical SAM enzyme
MKLTGITWITTYNCNISCAHCFFETQGLKKYMDTKMVDEALASLKNTKHMFWQHLSGGEIFLEEERLFDIIRTIRKHFKKDIGLSTNAFWAKEEEQTINKLKTLEGMGVTGIALSADYYHQQCMRIKGPQLLAKLLKERNLNTHSYIMGARLASDVLHAEEINNQSEKIAAEVNQNLDLPYAKATERSIGKGSLINVPKKKGVPQGKCTELNTCLGERSPFNPAMIWIDPYGNVSICYGVIIGNLHQQSLNDIVENYNPEKFPYLQELAEHGPKTLYNACLEKGIEMPTEYYDECDLCYQSRLKLKEISPAVFGPEECYPV